MKEHVLEQEFSEIFHENYPLLYRTAYSLTGSKQDAEDVVQAIFLRLLQRETALEVPFNLKGYLYRSTVNQAISVLRARKRQNLQQNVECLELPARPAPEGVPEDIREVLLNAVAQLRPRAVQILILHYEHNYSDREIAKMLGASRGTIAVTLYRARVRLKKLMQRALAVGKRP